MASPGATSHCIRTVSGLVAVTISVELMLGVLVIVRASIVELVPGPLLGVVGHARGTFYLFLHLIAAVLLLVLKVPVRAGAGAQLIEGALIPNDIGLAHLLRMLRAVFVVLLNVPRHYSWWPFRLRVRDGPRSDRRALELQPLQHLGTHIFRLLGQGEVVEVGSEV